MKFRYSPPFQGIVSRVKNLFSGKEGESGERELVDVDDEGRQLYKEDIIADILQDLEQRKTARAALDNQWRINANFLVGNQYCDFNPYSREIEQLAIL